MRSLLVEDDAPLADVIARNLLARGHARTVTGTAKAAVLAMAELWPDAAIAAFIIAVGLLAAESWWAR